MYARLTDRARGVIQRANQEALRLHHEFVGTEHLLLALIQEDSGVAANALRLHGLDLLKLRLAVEQAIPPRPDRPAVETLPHTAKLKQVIDLAVQEAANHRHDNVGTAHLLLGLLRHYDNVAAQVLVTMGVKLQELRDDVLKLAGPGAHLESPGPSPGVRPETTRTPVLDHFGLDLTKGARDGRLGPIVGRREEMERLVYVLHCRGQNNPVLVGPPGVGKATIVKSFARFSAEAMWPAYPLGPRLVALDLAQLLAGLEEADLFKAALRDMVNEVRQADNIILFVNDLSALFTPGLGHLFAYGAGVFRSALSRGEIRCLATATPAAFQACFGGDTALGRYFRPILVNPLSPAETAEVLRLVRPGYETFHHVRIQDDALAAAVELSERFPSDQALPGKAVNVLDEACARVRLRSAPPPPELANLSERIRQVNREKENAVGQQDFPRAAALRDEVEHLQNRKAEILRRWPAQAEKEIGTVDRQAVVLAVRAMNTLPAR